MSCHSVLLTQISREETQLTQGEKRHMAGYLEEMALGWDGMQHGGISTRRKSQDRYERALADFLREWDDHQSLRYWQTGTVFATQRQAFRIEFDPAADKHLEVPPPQIDQLIMPSRLQSRVTDNQSQRQGVGVPVVGHIRRTSEMKKELPFLPPNGGNLTLTEILDFGDPPELAGTPRRCRLHLHNSLNVETVKLKDDQRQLAANFTAAKQLALSKRSLNPFKWLGLFYPERMVEDCQLFRMDVYDPNRILVVFVHGLMSDPHIWLNVVSAISADPELRAAYQPWYFLYPSALSITQSSGKLRDSLRQALDHFDPDHNDTGPKNMVLVGHSMGGLVSRMQAIDPGDELWNTMLHEPPEKLSVSASMKERLMHDLRFKPQPEIKRLIFIATPHRGSNIASKNIVRRLSSLIRLPVDALLMSQELLSGNTDALSPVMREWGVYGFLSLGMLSEKHPFFQGLNSVRIPVQHHSIIGQLGKTSLINSSDGVVPYKSSHLDSAESEKIVPHWHGCVESPEVVQEVIRVLHEHLRESRSRPR